jgi:hypothetical protein
MRDETPETLMSRKPRNAGLFLCRSVWKQGEFA